MFTPVETSIGAFLLHQASSALLFQNGTIMGASGYMRRVISTPTRGTLAFFAGMALSVFPLKIFLPDLVTVYPPVPTTWPAAIVTAAVGALVGWGTKASSGCTSGHMLCGLARLSGWSTVAVATFFPVAMITHHLVHPSLRTEVCASDIPCYTPTYPSRATTISLLILAATTVLATRLIPRLVANLTKKEGKEDGEILARQSTELFAGLEFGLGLHISKMASPAKVLAFMSFPDMKLWDPSMALVILFGILPSLIEIQARSYSKPPLFNTKFDLPNKTFKDVDWKFVLGAAVFGVGWGLTGTCPGPAILRAYAQPTWGMLWMGGFWLGGQLVPTASHTASRGAC